MGKRVSRSLIALAIAPIVTASVAPAAVTWTGSGGSNWATGSSWSNGVGPSTFDTAAFGDAGSTNLPGELTSIVNTSRTIGGLTFNNTSGKFHTLDLGASTLTITGNLHFNTDQSAPTTTTIRNGSLDVSGPFASINVGRGVSGASNSTVDLTSLTSMNATIQSLLVGSSTALGAIGTFRLPTTNTIDTPLIQVGASNGSSDTRGSLRLGLSNTILADEFIIGKDNSVGTVDIRTGAVLNLGTTDRRTFLSIARQSTETNNTYTGVMNLGNASVNLHLSSLYVAEKRGGPGATTGSFFGGGSGHVTIGDVTTPGDWYVAYTPEGGSTHGTADLSALDTLDATLNAFAVGYSPSGSATGIVSLPETSIIRASGSIVVGAGEGHGSSSLNLGRSTTLLTNQLTVGEGYTNGRIVAPAGGSVTIGSSAQPTSLAIGVGDANSNNTYTGRLELTGASLNGHFGQIIVGQKYGFGGGSAVGTIFGANGGSITIGSPTQKAAFLVGHTPVSPVNSVGNVDLSGVGTMTAHLSDLYIGVSTAGAATGNVKLPVHSNIVADSIVVGSKGNSSEASGIGTLTLGIDTTILTNQLTIGRDYANGVVTIPTGGRLTLGTPTQRTSITMATGITETNSTYTGILDLGSGTLVAYLDSVVIGSKNVAPGGEAGTFTVSSSSANYIEINTLTLGGFQSSGNFTFGGGRLHAGSIVKGANAGVASFIWSGGQVGVGTFGAPMSLFNLNNTGAGTLAPALPDGGIGVTNIFGNYTQSSPAGMSLRLVGASPGTGNDQVNISGSATLSGSLYLSSGPGFAPGIGENYLLATWANRSGSFTFVAPPSMPQDVAFQLDYATNPQQLMLRTVQPISQTFVSPASATDFATAANWSSNTTPGTASSLTMSNSGASPQNVTVGASTTVHRIELSGPGASMNLQVPQGIRLGVANEVVVGNGASLTGGGQVLGNVTAVGGTVAPGLAGAAGQMKIGGTYEQDAAATLEIDIGGTVATSQFDQLIINRHANLGGALSVQLLNGFTPEWLDRFSVLTYASRTDVFDTVSLLGGEAHYAFVPMYGSAGLELVYARHGDANLDGHVDVRDLLMLANGWLGSGLWTEGDFNSDGLINQSDLTLLAQNWQAGNGAPLGPALEGLGLPSVSVPEPAAGMILIGLLPLRRRRRMM